MQELHIEVLVAHPRQLAMAIAQHIFPTLTYGVMHVVHTVIELHVLQNGISSLQSWHFWVEFTMYVVVHDVQAEHELQPLQLGKVIAHTEHTVVDDKQ